MRIIRFLLLLVLPLLLAAPAPAQTKNRPAGKKKPEKVKEPKKPKKPKEPKASKMHWIKDIGSKVKIGVLNFYDEMTREEEDENNLKTEE